MSTGTGKGAESDVPSQPCPSLGKVLERLFRDDRRPRILQLGPFSGRSAVHLAERGARVTVDEIDVSTLRPDASDPEAAKTFEPSLRLDHDDASFDLILLWDALDFVPKAGLPACGPEMARLLDDEGWMLMLAGGDVGTEEPPPAAPDQFEILGPETISRRPVPGAAPQPRYQHPTRRLEKAMAPLIVDGVHLRRSQIREFLLKKPARSPRRGDA